MEEVQSCLRLTKVDEKYTRLVQAQEKQIRQQCEEKVKAEDV